MKRILLYGCLLFSNIGFAQENLTAYYQYKTSFLNSNLNGVSIVYELNKKGDEANFEIRKNDKFYDGQIYNYANYKDMIVETQRNYKGQRAIIFNSNKTDWAFKDETKVINNCNAKRADFQFELGKLTHKIEIWYCPSEMRFSPIDQDINYFDIPGYIISYKETLNNKAKMTIEYNLLEFKENNTIQIKRPNEGERINYDLIDKGFTTSNN